MRTLVIGAVLAALAVPLAACGGGGSSVESARAQKTADLYAIDQIEKTWHESATRKDVDMMMSLWAPDATFTFGGSTASGKAAIRKVIEQAGPWQPQNDWVSDTPAYKIRTTVSGDRGTLYFECHYVDVKTGKIAAIVANDQDLEKTDGKWLITNVVAATPTLKP